MIELNRYILGLNQILKFMIELNTYILGLEEYIFCGLNIAAFAQPLQKAIFFKIIFTTPMIYSLELGLTEVEKK